MSATSEVIVLLAEQRYLDKLVANLQSFSGQRKLEYVGWLKSIGLEVKYK